MKRYKITMLIMCCLSILFSCAEKKYVIKNIQKIRAILTARTLGVGYLEESKLAEAEEQFKEIIALAPHDALGYANLGLVYLRSSKYDVAEAQLRKALKYDNANAEIHLNLAILYELTGKYEVAIAELKTSLKMQPSDVKTLYALAELYKNYKDDASNMLREQYLRKLVQHIPANIVVRLQYVEMLLQNNKPDSALMHLEEIRRQLPEMLDQAETQFKQAITALQNGEPDKAIMPARIFHNYLKVMPLYQANIFDLKGLGGKLVGFPVMTFNQTTFVTPQGENPILSSIQFSDVTTSAGLDSINQCTGEITDFNPDNLSVTVADYDNDGDDDLYFSMVYSNSKNWQPFLLKNEQGKFVDVTSESNIAHKGEERSAIFADFDNDGYLDLYVGKSILYRNQNSRTFRDVMSGSGIDENVPANHAVAADFDLDSDLDLYTLHDSFNQLYRNNLDGTFSELSRKMKISGDDAISTDAAIGDFDEDGDVDLVVVGQTGSPILYSNLRQGQFADISKEAGLSHHQGLETVAVGDYNNDGFLDIFVAGSQFEHSLYQNINGSRFTQDAANDSIIQSLKHMMLYDAKFLDFDNDGYLDLLMAGESQSASDRGMMLLHNNGFGTFDDVSEMFPEHLNGGRKLAITDYDNDGDVDIIVAGLDGQIRLIRNDGGNSNRYLKVKLVGLRTGSGKNNYFGTGAKLEVRAGELYQSRIVTTPITHFGLGQRTSTDVVRVVWTNGVPQNEFKVDANQNLVEQQILKGSCAFLYAWNGEKFSMVTDVIWRSALGMPLGIMAGQGGTAYAFADASKEYIKIPGHMLRERNGKYSLRITEELWETLYFDELKLVAVDHPDSVDIYVDERFTLPPFGDMNVFQVTQKRLPVKATEGKGNDVLPKIKEKDDDYLANLTPTKYQGLTELHDLILELDDFSQSDKVHLYLYGWLFPTDASINVAIAQTPTVNSVAPYLQVKDSKGQWQTVVSDFGFPMGKNKMVIIDLTGKFLSSDRHIRIRTNMEIYWDHIFYSVDPTNAPLITTTMLPETADLHYRGFSRPYRKGNRYGPHWFDYNDVSTEQKWRDLIGNYTRFGDVLPLLTESDDQYVIVNSGDEISVEFDATQAPELQEGWKRDFLIYTVGWIKDGDLNTAHGQTVEPLPFHGMTQYPYGSDESYPDDNIHQQYLKTYNTREVTMDTFREQIHHVYNSGTSN